MRLPHALFHYVYNRSLFVIYTCCDCENKSRGIFENLATYAVLYIDGQLKLFNMIGCYVI